MTSLHAGPPSVHSSPGSSVFLTSPLFLTPAGIPTAVPWPSARGLSHSALQRPRLGTPAANPTPGACSTSWLLSLPWQPVPVPTSVCTVTIPSLRVLWGPETFGPISTQTYNRHGQQAVPCQGPPGGRPSCHVVSAVWLSDRMPHAWWLQMTRVLPPSSFGLGVQAWLVWVLCVRVSPSCHPKRVTIPSRALDTAVRIPLPGLQG